MPDYELTRLGSRAFEQLIVSLCRAEIGPGVQVFGDGPDGGREATFDGTINWSATAVGSTAPDDRWTGYTILQSKFMQKPKAEPIDNARWLQTQIRNEIGHWTEAREKNSRTRYPDYLIFVTNVDLSPVARTGGIDTLELYVRQLLGRDSEAYQAGLRVRSLKIWHGEQVRSMVDAHPEIRRAFDGLLTIGDVLDALHSKRPELGTLNLNDPLRTEMVVGLQHDRWIRLSESGGPGGDKMALDDVVVDLPAVIEGDSDAHPGLRAVRHVLERGDTVLRAQQPDRTGAPGVVLVGGPGQGKTTLSQLIAQAYRTAMLQAAELAPRAQEIVDATGSALRRVGLDVPANRRWPIRVDLAKYAEHLSTGADTSLLRWISAQVSKRAVVEVQPAQLHTWLRVCPWVLILDGLDEVPSLASRHELYTQLETFISTAEDVEADLLLVVTTRPSGYDDRLPKPWYEHLNLRPLPPDESASFADRLTAKRFEEDPERRAEVAARMARAAADPATARMMETPLQVTVMSMIVEKFPTLPPDRFTLFDLYYRTMFEREVAKGIATSRFLADHRQHIDGIHERVGLMLQIQSQSAARAEAVLPPDELYTLAVNLLETRGYDRPEAEQAAERIVQAALQRLVLLVPRDGGLGYEIRTLQELMAARAVTEGRDDQVIDRLRLLADHPHWRNTWLLAAGKLLITSSRFEELLADVLRGLGDGRQSLGRRLSSGPALAADLLEDGLAAQRPGFERSLVQVLLSVIEYAVVADLRGIAAALDRLLDGRYRDLVLERLTGTADGGRRATAGMVLDLMMWTATSPTRQQTVQLARGRLQLTEDEMDAVGAFLGEVRPLSGEPVLESVAAAVLGAVDGLGLTDQETAKLTVGLDALGASQFTLSGADPAVAVLRHIDISADPEPLLDVVTDPDLGSALDLGLSSLPPGHWSLPALVAVAVNTAKNRRAVGEQILTLMNPGMGA